MVYHDSTGPNLQLVGDRFSNFLLRKLSFEFKLRGMLILHEFQIAIFTYCYGHMVGHDGSPICIAHADMTLTWSKVKVKVTDFLNFHKLHFSTSISSAILVCSSKLMVDYYSMGPSLQLFRPRFMNFSSSWWSRDFKVREMLISSESTGFYLWAACGYKLVIVTADRTQQAMDIGSDDRQHPCGAFFI